MTDGSIAKRLVVLPYLRQSESKDDETADDSLSLDAQLSAIRRHAAAHGLSLLPAIRDHDLRGADPDRPGIQTLRERIAAGGVDAVIVFDLKRFARDYVWQELTYRELTARGVRVISLHDPHIDHTLNRGIIGVVNQYQTEEIARYVAAACAERARRGIHHGKAPFGYRKADDRLILVPAEATWVEWVFTQYLAGWSGRAIARALTAQHVPTPNSRRAESALGKSWNSQMVHDILDRLTYTGQVQTGEIVAAGLHDPIISAETFAIAQRLRRQQKRVRRERPTSWLEHLVFCGCGQRCRVARTQRDGLQFRCTADLRAGQECGTIPRNITVAKAEAATVAALIADLERVTDWATTLRQAQERQRRQLPDAERERHRLACRLAELERERERLLDLYAQGKLTMARWDAADVRLAGEAESLTQLLATHPPPPDAETYRSAAAALSTLQSAVERVATHEPAALRRMLQRLDVHVVIAKDSGRYATIRLAWPATLQEFISRADGP
ncbi:MAG TPA: recombinase family protein [Tepidisphaeraceae bacterium]|jgi:DNA invertase Pin-like site-specific DNA recombinase